MSSSVTVHDLFVEKWRNFVFFARSLACNAFPKLQQLLATAIDENDPEKALLDMAVYLQPMRIFVITRAEEELLTLLSTAEDTELSEEVQQLAASLNSHTKDKLWRYAVFFLGVVDTFTTNEQQ